MESEKLAKIFLEDIDGCPTSQTSLYFKYYKKTSPLFMQCCLFPLAGTV